MQQHGKNGLAVAKFLESHQHVERVFHPRKISFNLLLIMFVVNLFDCFSLPVLPSHPQHEIALKQQSGHSGMVTFYIKGDSHKFLKALKVFILAESLGGFESLAELPYVINKTII